MNKKIFSVNLIIFLLLILNCFYFKIYAQEPTNTNSINLKYFELTPIIISPTNILLNNIINKQNNIINNKQNENNQSNNNQQKQNNDDNNQTNSFPKINNGLIYYTQYVNYYKLPNGCTIHSAGCGPTTSAMIIASYVDKSITPEKVVDYFAKNRYYAGCRGTSIYDNKTVIESFGVKTSADVMSFSLEESDKVIPLIKNYLKAGWKFFALANFKENGGGHFFWIVDIDDNGNIWAYDPWYGRNSQPFNENTYYPFPKYRKIFKVRK